MNASFKYQLILGSASPRRQELLKGLGYEFKISPTHADESFPTELKAQEIPLFLAKKKAEAYNSVLTPQQILITSDTIVWCDNKVLNKPENFEDGKRMLQVLSGKMHEVFTAVCLKSANKYITFYDRTAVYFKELSEDEIVFYLNNYKPYDKAGSYGAQDWMGLVGIHRLEGSFYNVMGLPVNKLYNELQKF